MAEAAASPLMQELLEEHKTTQPGWALDLGCGTGRAFLPLAKAGYRVIGVDPTPRCVQICRQRARQAKISAYPLRASAAHLPIPIKAIDFVLAISCLFHLGPLELTGAIREIYRVLLPKGTAILHFLDLEDWRRTLAEHIQPEQVPYPGYQAVVTCFCSPEKVGEWIAQAGLMLEKLELRSNVTDRGEQRNWLAYCTKLGW